MKCKLIIAAAAMASVFTACGQSAQLPQNTSVSDISETISAVSEDISQRTDTATLSETTVQTVSSEIITETGFSEILSITQTTVTTEETTVTVTTETEPPVTESETSEQTETESISETAPPLTDTPPVQTPAVVEIPEIAVGSFTGENVLENEFARIDCSDTTNGVIRVDYMGQCAKVKVRITCRNMIYDYDLQQGGSVFPLQSGSGSYNIKVLENVSGKTYAIAYDTDFDAQIADELRPYLVPSQYIDYSRDSKCVYTAAQLCSGKNSESEKIAAMFKYVTDNISYDKQLAAEVKSGYIPDPDRTLASGKGICFDYASLFAAMCRSNKIPAKLIMGYVEGNLYHAWNEVYTEETGWVTVDLFLDSGWTLLDPTFYASSDDKSEISQYIGNGNNYSAVYCY